MSVVDLNTLFADVTLNELLLSHPQFSDQIYNMYQNIVKEHSKDQGNGNSDILIEAYFLRNLTPLIKNKESSLAIKSRYEELEKKSWDRVTSDKRTIKYKLGEYISAFPQNVEKAFNEVKENLNPFFNDDSKLLEEFYKVGIKNPDFAKTLKEYKPKFEERARKTADVVHPCHHN